MHPDPDADYRLTLRPDRQPYHFTPASNATWIEGRPGCDVQDWVVYELSEVPFVSQIHHPRCYVHLEHTNLVIVLIKTTDMPEWWRLYFATTRRLYPNSKECSTARCSGKKDLARLLASGKSCYAIALRCERCKANRDAHTSVVPPNIDMWFRPDPLRDCLAPHGNSCLTAMEI